MEPSTSTKTRLVWALLVIITIWPVVHRALVAQYEIDPWRFFGLAMYATERPGVGLRRIEAGATVDSLQRVSPRSAANPSALREAVSDLIRAEQAWGALADATTHADRILAQLIPEGPGHLVVALQRFGLDEPARRTVRAIRYECRRAARHTTCEVTR